MKTSSRADAREKIIQAANRWVMRKHLFGLRLPPTLFGPRHLQRAVCIVRRHQLVKPDVLAAAWLPFEGTQMTSVITPRRAPNGQSRLAWAPFAAAVAGVEVNRVPLGGNSKAIARRLDVDVRQLHRWKRDGITPDVADRVCFAIGRHPAELWIGWGEWT